MRKIVLLICFSMMTACTGGGSSTSNEAKPESPESKTGAPKPTISINEDDIKSKNYTLKSDLSFLGADSDRYKFMEGTKYETEMVSYYFGYENQKRLTKQELAAAPSFCSVYVEAPVGTPADAAVFKAFGRLLKGQMTTFVDKETSIFTLQLQGQAFNSFFLKCKNVADSSGVNTHLGHILDIK